ncbi:nucleotide exchange factor GrpE [Sapientia aquatica]|uniref:Protein GrpE n=1 Tax=Sapientia aquatica TaxID=1549640 RepID=A0A4R5W3F6_9BURK|nr:nucleotide exchange factor GrpE [Sapientia aquatica]TDK67259.1 nucleotide exchange factor GrpE [Sapientia aquatica]
MQDQAKPEVQNDQVEQAPATPEVEEPVVVAVDSDFEEKLLQTEAKLAELQDAYLRAKADGENIRRRAQDDISKAHKFAVESFAESMIPVKDSLEMALKIENVTVESLKEGTEVTLRQLVNAFEKNRLLEINPVRGEKLDPAKHQAVSMVPADQDANTVVEVLQKGYTIADRLLRPALVTVAQAK